MGKALAVERREQRHAPAGQFRPVPAVLAVAVAQDARFQGSGGDHPPLDGVDRRRQPGLSALDRGRQAQRGLDPLLAGQCDRHSCASSRCRSNQWVHVTITYDGSSRAERPGCFTSTAAAPRARSSATISPGTSPGGGNDHLTVGQRFRDRGFKNGLVDEIKVFDRELTPLEVAQLHDGKSLDAGLVARPGQPERPRTRRPACLLPGHGRPRVQEPAGGAQGLAAEAQRTGRSGGRDHGDERDAAAPADLFAQARGLRCPARPRRARHAGQLAAAWTSHGRVTGSGLPVADGPQSSADGPRGGEPLVAGTLRPRDRGDARGFRQPGTASRRTPSFSTGWRGR